MANTKPDFSKQIFRNPEQLFEEVRCKKIPSNVPSLWLDLEMVAVESVIEGRITKPFRRLLNAGVVELIVHAILDPEVASDALDIEVIPHFDHLFEELLNYLSP